MMRKRRGPSISARILASPRTARFTPNLFSKNVASIETDAAGYPNVDNCVVARSTTYAADGAASLRITASAGGNASFAPALVASTPGTAYTCRAEFRAGSVTRSCGVYIEWFDAGLGFVSGHYGGTFVADSLTSFVAVSATSTAPTGGVWLKTTFVVASAGAGEIHYMDKAGAYVGVDASYR